MGHQVIKQPDGRLCVYSTVVGKIIIEGATAQELMDFYARRAAMNEREQIRRITTAVLAGDARSVYAQFAMSYEEARGLPIGEDEPPEDAGGNPLSR